MHIHPQKFRNFRRAFPYLPPGFTNAAEVEDNGGKRNWEKAGEREKPSSVSYCNASSKRVIVRFKSLSDRRISSILLMECSTVV